MLCPLIDVPAERHVLAKLVAKPRRDAMLAPTLQQLACGVTRSARPARSRQNFRLKARESPPLQRRMLGEQTDAQSDVY